MQVFLAKLWVVFMVVLTLASAIALLGWLGWFIVTVIGWVPLVALAGMGAGMTVLFKITSWADKVLERNKTVD